MDSYLQLDPGEQRTYCEEVGARLGLSPSSVEKDFWVCWMLRELFSLPEIGSALTFKGGTSLSKGWGLIQRFSEDIDIVIDREAVGASAEPPGTSRKLTDKYLEALSSRASAFIRERLHPELQSRLGKRLPPELQGTLRHSGEDPNNEALLYEYASRFDGEGYVVPVVKIEPGARSDTDPAELREIQPFLAEILGATPSEVRCVHPRRTFWEKAMLLHEELSREDARPPKPRLARHFYDVYKLIGAGIGDEALADWELFEAVAAHRRVFFRRSKKIQDAMKPGTFRLSPDAEQLPHWQRDYDAMREVMFYGEEPPAFAEILDAVGEFEARLDNVGNR